MTTRLAASGPLTQFTLSPAMHGVGDLLERTVRPLQQLLRAAIEKMPQRPKSANALARLVKMDASTTWRLWQAAHAETLEGCAFYISGESALDRFLLATVKNGLDPELSDGVRVAFEQFRMAVDQDIGDMPSLRMMLSTGTETFDTRFPRVQYDATRARLGVQAAASLRVLVRTPSAFEGLVDFTQLRVTERLRSLRDDRSHLLHVRRFVHRAPDATWDEQWKSTRHVEESLVLGAMPAPEAPGLTSYIPELSELNGRQLYQRPVSDTEMEIRTSGGLTGKRGESTIGVGGFIRAASRNFEHDPVGVVTEVRVPTELLVVDLYLSDFEYRMGIVMVPQVFEMMYSDENFPGSPVAISNPDIQHYAPNRPRTQLSEFPRYDTLSTLIENRIGESLLGYHLFRWQIPLPLVGRNYILDARRTATER